MFTDANNPVEDFDVTLLHQTAARLSERAPVQELLEEAARFVAAVANCDSCMIYLLEGQNLILRSPKSSYFEGAEQSKSETVLSCDSWVAENRQPLVIGEQAHTDSRFKMFNESPQDRFESFLSFPLVGGGRLVGIINLQNRAPHYYSDRVVNLITPVASLLGIQIERGRLEAGNSEILDSLETRKVVNRAKMILQRDLNIDEEDAHRILQRESQNRNKPVREIAQAIILMNELKQPFSTTATKGTQA